MRSTTRATRLAALSVAFAVLAACGGADVGDEASEDGTAAPSTSTDASTPSEGDGTSTPSTRRLSLVSTNGPQTLDPIAGVTPCEVEMLGWIYDSLIYLMPDGTYAPGLAESWESPDPNTFVLHLREGVEFQDGTPFDADAVRMHLERAKSDPSSSIQSALAAVDEITTTDELTVTLDLSEPIAGILPQVMTERAGRVPSPTAVAEAGDDAPYGTNGAVGAGPYAFESYVPGEDLHVDAWDGYWNAENRHLAGIDHLGKAAEFQIERILSGELTYAALKDVQLAEVEAAADAGDIGYEISATDQYAEVYINWEMEPFDDVRVRQALNHAIDRELLAESLTAGAATPASSPIREDSWAFPEEVRDLYPYDPERARELLAEAGYPDGVSITVGAIVTAPYFERLAQAVQDMVSESGFDVELESVAGAEINNRLYQLKDLPVAVTSFAGSADPGVTLANKFSSTGNSNPAGTTAEGVDELIAEGHGSLDPDRRAEAYQGAVVRIMEEALSVPIYHEAGIAAFSPDLTGVERGYTTCETSSFVATPPMFVE